MKKAKEYLNWQGPLDRVAFEKLRHSTHTLVWYSNLCPQNQQSPEACDHQPISIQDYRNLSVKPDIGIYYHQPTSKHLVEKITLLAAIIGLITAILAFGNFLCTPSQSHTIVVVDSTSQGDTIVINDTTINQVNITINDTIVLCNNCDCHCEYEDIGGESNGKKAKFRVVYLTQEKRWKYSNETTLQDGTLLADNLRENLSNFPNFEESLGLVAVGTASEEGTNRLKEEKRADRRADEILYILRMMEVSRNKELYKLNLGQYMQMTGLSTSETAYQRRVIIIAIMGRDESMSNTEIKGALKDALMDSEGLNYDVEMYSMFEFTREN